MAFKLYYQYDAMDCGPACIRMIAAHYGRNFPLEFLRENCHLTRNGVNFQTMSAASEKIGFRTLGVKVEINKLKKEAPLPCIIHWNQNHFVVLYKIRKGKFHIADPAKGLQKLREHDFSMGWLGNNREGAALLFETTPEFYTNEILHEDSNEKLSGFKFLLHYVRQYKKFVLQLFFSMIAGTLLSLIFPFLTQGLVDYGINKQDISFVQLILASQIVLFIGGTLIDVVRAWLMLHMNTRINISLISDFLVKLMKLPISYFDTKQIGDIKQRIADHGRIQSFLTGSALSTLFSLVNLIVFTIIMAIYSTKILLVFAGFSIIGALWIVLFLKRRKQLDYLRFQNASNSENVMYELLSGMQEIKLNNGEREKRWGWERVQTKLFKISVWSLALGQTQSIGTSFFNQLKNIIISYLSAKEVINGNMTLGMMMSISYIVGQLNSPIQQLLSFVQSAQDAKISLDRLSEIHHKKNEERDEFITDFESDINSETDSAIHIKNLSFQYEGIGSPYALKNVSLNIPLGKTTAIVGMSGSGKTTLLKLLLRYYSPTEGIITVNGYDLQTISPSWWRERCGVVMQDGYIFNDTISDNISIGDTKVDKVRLKSATKIANLENFIKELPLGYKTRIGFDGLGISAGQKQRILIARAVYKSPDYLFFDEATNALDSTNELEIMDKLNQFFVGKTVVVVAHRLSTVKNAHQIVVMERGQIAEIGTHEQLVKIKGKYFELVRNQLELEMQ